MVGWQYIDPNNKVKSEVQAYYEGSCDKVIQAMADYANCTNCMDRSAAKIKDFPELKLYIGKSSEKYIKFNVSDLLQSL